MSRMLMTVALVVFGVSAVQAATNLDISIAAQGANYNNMVRDAKLRGDGGLADWNLGAGSGDSQRFYPNYLGDGTTGSGRQNNFLQWFDVSSIPTNSTINSAILTVYLANQSANNRTWTNVHLSRLQPGKDWVESVTGGTGPHFDGSVTWNNQISQTTPPPVPWATPGALGAADIDLGSTKTFDLVGVADTATTNVQDITSWVQYWVNTPTNNTGMLWWGGNFTVIAPDTIRYFWFGAKEDGEGPPGDGAAAAPTLFIDYTLAGTIVPFTLINPNRSNDTFSVSFATQSGATYKLQYKDLVSDVTWNDGNSIAGDGSVKTLTNSSAQSSRFYRVSAQ